MKNTIGSRIKDLRHKKGLPQVDLARLIGVSKQTLYKYENDIITNIPSDKIEALAYVLDTTPSYLMGWGEFEDVIEDSPVLRIGLRNNSNSLFFQKHLKEKIIESINPSFDDLGILKQYCLLDDRGKSAVKDTVEREFNYVENEDSRRQMEELRQQIKKIYEEKISKVDTAIIPKDD